MSKKIFDWVKVHKLLTFNLLVVLFIFFIILKNVFVSTYYNSVDSMDYDRGNAGMSPIAGSINPIAGNMTTPNYSKGLTYEESQEMIPVQDADDSRRVITNSNLSLLVKDVDSTVEDVRQKVIDMGGFMVNTNIRRDAEASSSTIEVRVPSDQLVEFSKYLRTLSVKVVYENITGTDITDQYTDYEERLSSLEAVKERFQEIMDEAETVDEIMNVQNRIFSIQNQIDSIKGQLTYMDRSTATSKVTITISTDELSLPYTPVKSWRPDVIAKNAIRSLISVLRALGTLMIWLVTFTPLIILFIALKVSIKYILKKRKNKKELVKNIK